MNTITSDVGEDEDVEGPLQKSGFKNDLDQERHLQQSGSTDEDKEQTLHENNCQDDLKEEPLRKRDIEDEERPLHQSDTTDEDERPQRKGNFTDAEDEEVSLCKATADPQNDLRGSKRSTENGNVCEDDTGRTLHSMMSGIGHNWGCRHTLAVMGFLGFCFIYALRVNLSFAIVAMVKQRIPNVTQGPLTVKNNSELICPLPKTHNMSDNKENIGEFDWDERTQGIILGAFYWGYTATNIIGGRAAEHLGGRLVFGLNIVTCAVMSLLTPLCARFSPTLLIIVRILAGAAQGGSYPSMAILFCSWIAPKDRSKFAGFVFAGSQIGTVVTMVASGWLCSSNFLGGWPSVFYVFGALGMLWGIPWFWLIRDSHESNPRVSQKELKYITQVEQSLKTKKVVAVPWRAICTSLPFWAIAFGSFGYNFGFYAILNGLPTYFANILHFDMKSNGLLSAMPYIGMSILSFVWGTLMDIFTHKNILSIRSVRRLSTGIGCYGPMLGLLAMNFIHCNTALALTVLVISVSISAANYCGYVVSYQEIAPNLTGTIGGISNTLGALAGILAPGITGFMIQNNQTPAAWRQVFLVSSGTFLVCTTFYIAFVTDQIQPWNEPEDDERRKRKLESNEAEKNKLESMETQRNKYKTTVMTVSSTVRKDLPCV